MYIVFIYNVHNKYIIAILKKQNKKANQQSKKQKEKININKNKIYLCAYCNTKIHSMSCNYEQQNYKK